MGQPCEIDSRGVGDVNLGDDRKSVRGRLGSFRVFRRAPDAPETDFFVRRGVQVTYDSAGRVEFIEVMTPADPRLDGVRLLQRPVAEVIADLRAQGVECVQDES